MLVLMGTGCAHGAKTEPQPTLPSVQIEVNNRYGLAMEIEARGGGASYRLGLVAPGMKAQFDLPQPLIALRTVVIMAHPSVSGPTYRSETIQLAPGDFLEFEITPQLFNSTVIVNP